MMLQTDDFDATHDMWQAKIGDLEAAHRAQGKSKFPIVVGIITAAAAWFRTNSVDMAFAWGGSAAAIAVVAVILGRLQTRISLEAEKTRFHIWKCTGSRRM